MPDAVCDVTVACLGLSGVCGDVTCCWGDVTFGCWGDEAIDGVDGDPEESAKKFF